MMRCDKCKGQLADYIDGILSNQDRLVLEDHIEQCPDCRQALQNMQELDTLLRQQVPPIWEGIEPTPQFMAQLKHMNLEPSSKPVTGIAEWFSSLWSHHRMALATGLSVCLVIALMFSGVIDFGSSDDDDETVVSRNEGAMETPMTAQAEESILSMKGDGLTTDDQDASFPGEQGPAGSTGPEESAGAIVTAEPTATNVPAPTVAEPTMTATLPPFSIAVPAGIDGWDCATEWLHDDAQQAPTILGYTSEQIELAVKIAIENLERLGVIGGLDPDHIVVSAEEDVGFSCDGLTVVLIREDSCIYTCIDVDAGEMTSYDIHPRQP